MRRYDFAADIFFLVPEEAPFEAYFGSSYLNIPDGYDYDIGTVSQLREMTVKNGLLTSRGGTSYKLLVSTANERVRPEYAKTLCELAEKGVAVAAERPVASCSHANHATSGRVLRDLVESRWSTDADMLGKGKVVEVTGYDQLLPVLGLPDFTYRTVTDLTHVPYKPMAREGRNVDFIHRKYGDADYYFVSNQLEAPHSIEAIFRISGRVPEIWDPQTGKRTDAGVFRLTGDGRTLVPLHLEPAQSLFIVFRRALDKGQVYVTHLRQDGNPQASRVLFEKDRLTIEKAHYTSGGKERKRYDVTKTAQDSIEDGKTEFRGISVGKSSLEVFYRYKDRAFVHKRARGALGTGIPDAVALDVRYPGAKILKRGQGIELQIRRPGSYELTLSSGKKQVVTVGTLPQPVVLDAGWQLDFPPGWDTPKTVELSELISWSDHSDWGIQHFSGTATYTRLFELGKDWLENADRIQFDLGHVHELAAVKLNGQDLGVLWKPPFELDVTGLVKPGENRLEIRVTNLWVNRLIGDDKLKPDYEYRRIPGGIGITRFPDWVKDGGPRPNPKRKTFYTSRYYRGKDALLSSGLLGPVKLVPVVTREITFP